MTRTTPSGPYFGFFHYWPYRPLNPAVIRRSARLAQHRLSPLQIGNHDSSGFNQVDAEAIACMKFSRPSFALVKFCGIEYDPECCGKTSLTLVPHESGMKFFFTCSHFYLLHALVEEKTF